MPRGTRPLDGGERAAGAVRAMHAWGEAHDQQARAGIPEGSDWSRMVVRMLGFHRIEEPGKTRAIATIGIEALGGQGRRTHL